jgi:hypothetical protein
MLNVQMKLSSLKPRKSRLGSRPSRKQANPRKKSFNTLKKSKFKLAILLIYVFLCINTCVSKTKMACEKADCDCLTFKQSAIKVSKFVGVCVSCGHGHSDKHDVEHQFAIESNSKPCLIEGVRVREKACNF